MVRPSVFVAPDGHHVSKTSKQDEEDVVSGMMMTDDSCLFLSSTCTKAPRLYSRNQSSENIMIDSKETSAHDEDNNNNNHSVPYDLEAPVILSLTPGEDDASNLPREQPAEEGQQQEEEERRALLLIRQTAEIQKQKKKRFWKWLVWYVFYPSFLLKACQRSTIPVLPVLIRTSLQGTDGQMGSILAAVAVGKLLGNLPAGQWIAVSGTATGLWASCGLLALAWLGAATTFSIWSLWMANCLEGLGLALWQVTRQVLVTEEINRNQGRGKVQSTISGFERFASIVGPSAGGWIATQFGLRAPFLVKSAIMAATLVWFAVWQKYHWATWRLWPRPQYLFSGNSPAALTLATEAASTNHNNNSNNGYGTLSALSQMNPNTTGSQQQQGSIQQITTTTTAAMQSPPLAVANAPPSIAPTIAATSPASSSSSSSLRALVQNWRQILQEQGPILQRLAIWLILSMVARETRHFLFALKSMDLGYGPHEIGVLTSITFAIDMSLFPLSGHIMDAYGRKYCAVPSGIILAVSYALAPFATNLPTLIAISTLGGVGNGLSGGVLMAVGSDLAPSAVPSHRALFLAIFRSLTDLGILTGLVLGGTVSQHMGITAAFGIVSLLSLLSAVWMAWFLPETRWQQTATATTTAIQQPGTV